MHSKTILVPIDFSKASIKALETAAKLALKIRGRLIVMNACQKKVAFFYSNATTSSRDLIKEQEEEVFKTFSNLKKSIKELNEVEHTFLVRRAFPPDAIISMTLMQEIDLIIIGTTGMSRIDGILLGSNTYAIAKNVECPILVIPEEADISKPFKNIGLAGNYKKTGSKNTFGILIEIAMAYQADIHSSKVSRINSKTTVESQKLKSGFADSNQNFFFRRDNDLDDDLNNYIEDHDIDLLVHVKKKKGSIDHIFNYFKSDEISTIPKVPFLLLYAK